jgi:uncharacterized damage-inducible protein DinB
MGKLSGKTERQRMTRRELQIERPEGFEPEVSVWVWLMEDTRDRTKQALEGISTKALDWTSDGIVNSVGTLLYHVVAIELDWLYADVLGRSDFPEEVAALLPHDVRDEDGVLVPVREPDLDGHLRRMDAARAIFLRESRNLDRDDMRRVRHLSDYDVTPEWVMHHLAQHEAEHRGQLMEIRQLAEQAIED